jgi:hypothetical protein
VLVLVAPPVAGAPPDALHVTNELPTHDPYESQAFNMFVSAHVLSLGAQIVQMSPHFFPPQGE